jgi:Domain of unknown function (DUF4347)
MPLGVWACCRDVPTTVCRDARLNRDLHWDPGTQGRELYGVSGYHWGINFVNFRDLIQQLAINETPSHVCGNWIRDCPRVGNGQITRLAINAHGIPGEFLINSDNSRPGLRADNLVRFQCQLNTLNLLLAPSATVLLMGCLCGQGPSGTELLTALSATYLRGRIIVGFSTVGVAMGGQMLRQGQQCAEPGMRDSNEVAGSIRPTDRDYGPLWGNLGALPWASETSPHAKVALNGAILRGADQ